MGDCITPSQLSDIASKDTNRIQGTIAKCLAANSVFMNVLEGGTFPAGVSDTQTTITQLPAAPGDSLAIPTFVADTDLCGTVGLQDKTGAVELTYTLEGKRGHGPRVCVKKGYSAFKSSYTAAEDSLKKLVSQYINSDIRAQLYLRSASKFVAAAAEDGAYCFEDLFTGGEITDLDEQFAQVPGEDIVPITFKAVEYLATYLKETLWADMYPSDGKGQEHFKFIGSREILNRFRAELSNGAASPIVSLVQGSYKVGETALTGYAFEQSAAYRGIAFGHDQTPLRSSAGFDEDGDLQLLNPRTNVADVTNNTAYSKHNSNWVNADLEVSFLIAPNAFKRLVPENYVGEGSFKFAPQLHMGELIWSNLKDNDCNVFQDFGQHFYQISRSYKPVNPQFIIPILSRRCKADLGLEACETTSCNSL